MTLQSFSEANERLAQMGSHFRIMPFRESCAVLQDISIEEHRLVGGSVFIVPKVIREFPSFAHALEWAADYVGDTDNEPKEK